MSDNNPDKKNKIPLKDYLKHKQKSTKLQDNDILPYSSVTGGVTFIIVNIFAFLIIGAVWFMAAWGNVETSFYFLTSIATATLCSFIIISADSIASKTQSNSNILSIILIEFLFFVGFAIWVVT